MAELAVLPFTFMKHKMPSLKNEFIPSCVHFDSNTSHGRTFLVFISDFDYQYLKETSIDKLHTEKEKMCNDSARKFRTSKLIRLSNLTELIQSIVLTKEVLDQFLVLHEIVPN